MFHVRVWGVHLPEFWSGELFFACRLWGWRRKEAVWFVLCIHLLKLRWMHGAWVPAQFRGALLKLIVFSWLRKVLTRSENRVQRGFLLVPVPVAHVLLKVTATVAV